MKRINRKSALLFSLSLLAAAMLFSCQSMPAEGAGAGAGDTAETDETIGEFVDKGYPKPQIVGHNGMVSSAGTLSSYVGSQILAQGGNAVDAAIAAAAMLTLEVPQNCSIGGHGIMMIYDAESGETRCIDFGGSLPQGFTIDQWGNPVQKPSGSVLSTIMPGTPAGWETALESYGTLSLGEALAPAIRYAEEGIPVAEEFLTAMGYMGGKDVFELYPDLAKVFLPNGEMMKPGELMKWPDLAKTYRLLAEKGTDAFYRGELTPKILKVLNEGGSRFTAEEFASYEPRWRETLSTTYRDEYEVFVPKAQSSSPQVLTLLNLWENYDFESIPFNSADYAHIMIESMRFARSNRDEYYGDPAFTDVPYDALVSKDYARKVFQALDMSKAGGNPWPADKVDPAKIHTTHLVTVDKEGNMVSLTQTIGGWFGAFSPVPGTGILLNDEGRYYSLEPENGPNYPEAGKLSQHDMSPTFVFKKGEPFMTVGTPGGEAIPQMIPQVIHHVIDYGMDPQKAIDVPRYLHWGHPMVYIDALAPRVVEELRARGHEDMQQAFYSGEPVAIMIDPETGSLWGGAEYPGMPVGY